MGSSRQAEDTVGELDLTALYDTLSRLFRGRALVGSMPHGPSTLRSSAGAVLVRLIRRALFWFWPQLDYFHAATIEFARCQISTTEQVIDQMVLLDEELYTLRTQVKRLRDGIVHDDPASKATSETWIEFVRCRGRLQSLSEEVNDLTQGASARVSWRRRKGLGIGL